MHIRFRGSEFMIWNSNHIIRREELTNKNMYQNNKLVFFYVFLYFFNYSVRFFNLSYMLFVPVANYIFLYHPNKNLPQKSHANLCTDMTPIIHYYGLDFYFPPLLFMLFFLALRVVLILFLIDLINIEQ